MIGYLAAADWPALVPIAVMLAAGIALAEPDRRRHRNHRNRNRSTP